MVGFLIKIKLEELSMNVEVNQWLEVMILWVLVLVLLKHSIFHHTKDLDCNQQSIKLILGMENS